MIFYCPMVGGSTIIATLKTIFVNHIFAEKSISLQVASWVRLYGMGIEVPREDSATRANDSLLV